MELLENPDLDEGSFDSPYGDESIEIVLEGPTEESEPQNKD